VAWSIRDDIDLGTGSNVFHTAPRARGSISQNPAIRPSITIIRDSTCVASPIFSGLPPPQILVSMP